MKGRSPHRPDAKPASSILKTPEGVPKKEAAKKAAAAPSSGSKPNGAASTAAAPRRPRAEDFF